MAKHSRRRKGSYQKGGNSSYMKYFSSILAFVMVFSLLSPFSASANTDVKPFKQNATNESTMELKAAIAEQLNVLEGGSQLHKDLRGLTGNQDVNVIVHLSEKPVALEKGISELAGKSFTSAQEAKVEAAVKSQQSFVKKEMSSKGISIKQGYTFDTVLNGFAATVKADDLKKLLAIKGVTLVEPDATVYAMENPKSTATSTPSELVKVDGKLEAAMNTSISFLGIEKLWAEGYEGQGIKVAVLDTGIDKDHPEFRDIFKGGINFIPNSSTYTKTRAADDVSETLPSERPAGTPEFNANGSSFYTSHGTHVAGTIAAIGANEYGIKGIAPKVDLYAYRVLGAYGSGSTSGIVAAIDEAVEQEMDVINLSLGGGPNSETDSGSFAINNAMMAGTISVIATGNSGPERGTMGTPSTAPLGIAVGNTTNPETMHNGEVNVTVGDYSLSKQLQLMGTTFGKDTAEQLAGEFDLVAVPGNGTAADYAGLDVDGKVVLVSRGGIAFVDKIAYAKENGAVGMLIHNFAGGTNAPDASGTFLGDSFAFIPTFDVSQTDGDAIRAALANGAGKVSFGNFASTNTSGDEVNDSSSRGPSTPNFDIKPDVTAPGTNIMSTIPMYKTDFPEAVYDEAYDRKTGTSMATPHIAGIAALVKQANPTWSAFDVKVALSNTAKLLDTEKYDVFSQGAGRVDAYAAAHPSALAYAIGSADPDGSGELVENLKGTVTFGPQSLEESISVTKQVLVKDLKGNGGDYEVTVDVTKSFGDAKVTVDKPSFTLNGEQELNVTLTSSATDAPVGSEILGYIHITGGETEISLPFAADFGGAAATEIKNMSITETDLSFDGDGVQDEAVLAFTLTGDVATNYIELWDIMNPDGGEYGDGYIGYLHASGSLGAGSWTLPIKGQYKPWGSAPATTIPDGLYTIDFTGLSADGIIGDYAGPVVVKTTDPVITSETPLVTDQGIFEFTGQVTDKYIDYNEELYWYGLDFDLNSKLYASYALVNPGGEVQQTGPITLAQDGSFTLDNLETFRGENTLTVTVSDAAGNLGSAEYIIENNSEQPTVVELHVDNADVNLTEGASHSLLVEEVTYDSESNETRVDVTADATYVVENEEVISVDKGVITAKVAGTSKVTVSYDTHTLEVNVTVTEAPVEPVVSLSINKDHVDLTVDGTEQITVTQTVTEEGKDDVTTDVTAEAAYVVENEAVVSVDKGLISAKAAGTSKVTVTYGDNTEVVNVTVTESPAVPVAQLSVNKDKLDLTVDGTEQLTVTKTVREQGKDDVTTDVTAEATYVVEKEAVVSVNKGLVTAKAAGTTKVTVEYEGISTTVEVTVKNKPVVNPPSPPAPPTNPSHVTVDQSNAASQAADPGTTEVTVKVSALTDGNPEVSVQVPTGSLNAIAQSNKPLVIQSGNTEVNVPNSVLKDIAAGTPDSTTVTVKKGKSTAVPGAVSDTYEFTITAVKSGIKTTVSTFSEPVQVTVPTTATVKDPRKVSAYYVDESAGSFSYVGGVYNNGTFVFETNHFSKFVVVETAKTFTDIQKHWAQDEIEVLASRSMTAGYTDTVFNTEGKVTRAEFAVLMARALNLPVAEYQGTFKDVTTGKEWAWAGVEAAQRAGIVNGKSADSFEPDAFITREEMATIIVRAVKYQDAALLKGVDTSKSFADDKAIGSFAKESVKQAVGLGIVSGRAGNKFDPKANATRAEAAVMLYRALDKLGEF